MSPSLAPADLPRVDDVSMNWTVLAFAMALSASTAFNAARAIGLDVGISGATVAEYPPL